MTKLFKAFSFVAAIVAIFTPASSAYAMSYAQALNYLQQIEGYQDGSGTIRILQVQKTNTKVVITSKYLVDEAANAKTLRRNTIRTMGKQQCQNVIMKVLFENNTDVEYRRQNRDGTSMFSYTLSPQNCQLVMSGKELSPTINGMMAQQ